VRNVYRSVFVTGLLLLSGLLSLLAAAPAASAVSTTVQITDVFDARNGADEWFQLYNSTDAALTLTDYQICPGNSTCIKIPTTTVERFTVVRIFANKLTGWPATGLNGANDMLGLLDAGGKPIDSVNWGTPNPQWRNYTAFKDMLFNPGITPPAPTGVQSFFRVAPGVDTDAVKDWLATTVSAETTPTAVTTGTTAARTATPGTRATPTRTPSTGATVNQTPTTGGEFPFLVTVALILAVLAVRYMRTRRSPASR
jgi:hypothetical protein